VYERSDAQSPGWLCRAGPALALTALVVLFLGQRFLWPAEKLTGNSVDLRYYFFPLYETAFGAIASGRLPLWNPYHLAGGPWLAALQGGFFYPPHLLYLWLPVHTGLALSHALHLALIAISTALLGRKAGLALPASCLAGMLFALSGTLQWWLFWPNMLEAASWLSLGCIAVLGLSRGEGARAACLLAFAAGMSLLAGHTQVTVFLLYAWATLLAALLVGARASTTGRAGAAASFAAALALGLLLSGIQTLPSFELTLEGTRRAAALAEPEAESMGIRRIGSLHGLVAGSHFSFGAIALALAPAALLARRQRRFALWALGLGAVAGALAFGSGTRLMHLYLALPGIGWFRQPHRLLFLTHFSAALMAGVALDSLLRRAEVSGHTGRTPRGVALAVLPVACALALAASAAFGGEPRAACLAAGAAVAAALCGWAPARLPAGLAAGAVLAAAGADLLLATSLREPLPYTAATSVAYRGREGGDLYRNLASLSGESRTAWLLFRVDVETKRAARYGLRRLEDFEPLNLRRQSEYFTYLQRGEAGADPLFSGSILPHRHLPGERLVEWFEEMGERSRLLDLAAVRFFAARRDPRRAGREAVRAFVRRADLAPRAFAGGGVALYENRRSLPRAYVTYRTAPAPPLEELLRHLSREDFDPLVASYVEGDPGFATTPEAPARGHAATLTRDDEIAVEVEAVLAAPGLLVLADSYARGWRARVDGVPAAILPTNHLFRGVPVPAGRHRVRFEYRPWSLRIGAAMSLAGVAVLVALALRSRGAARGTAA
jgi:hypothetical protein